MSRGLLVFAAQAPLMAVMGGACTGQDADLPLGQQEANRQLSQQEPQRETWSLRVLTLDMGRAYTLTDDGVLKKHVAPDSKLEGKLLVETTRDAIVATNPATGELVHEILWDDAFHPDMVYLPLTDFCPATSTVFFVDGDWLYRHRPGERTSQVFYIRDVGSGPIFGSDKRLAVSPDGETIAVIRSSDRFEDNTAQDRYGDLLIYDLETKELLHIMPGEQCYWLNNDVLVVVDHSDEIATHKWNLKLWSKDKGIYLEEKIGWMTLAIGQGEFSIIESGEKLLLHRRALDGSALGTLALPDSVVLPSQGITYYVIRNELRAGD